jgi:hypothetical protein
MRSLYQGEWVRLNIEAKGIEAEYGSCNFFLTFVELQNEPKTLTKPIDLFSEKTTANPVSLKGGCLIFFNICSF